MRKLYWIATLFLCALPSFAQTTFSNGGNITSGGADCSTATNCVSIQMPGTASSITVTITGTFSATLTFEKSGDNGKTWAILDTQIATGVYTYTVASLTNVRVRASAYTSGNAGVFLNVSTASVGTSSISGGGAGGTFTIQNTACSSTTNCLQLVDDDSTDNCGTPLNTFMTNVNAYTGTGVPAVFITDSNAAGKGYKFATTNCHLVFTFPATIHMYATIDCAMTGTNCIQFGPTGLGAGAVQYSQKYQIDGGGTFLGGVNLTVSGIECESWLANCIIKDINWLNFGATNATAGLCTNYAVQFDNNVAEGGVIGNEWLTTDSTPRRCAFTNPLGQATGQNTIMFFDNVLGGAGLGATCSSVGITDGGSYGESRGNNIYGFGMSIRVQGIGHRINSNQMDSAGCTISGVNSAVYYGATGSSTGVGTLGFTNNVGEFAATTHLNNFLAKAPDSSASLYGAVVTGNHSPSGGTVGTTYSVLAANTPCTNALSANTGCYIYANPGLVTTVTCGATNANWYSGDLAASCANQTLTANLTTQTLRTPIMNEGLTITAQVLLTTAATTSSTLPQVSVTYTDVFTNATLTILLTPVWATSTVGCTGTVTNTVGNACMGTSGIIAPKPATAITYTTSNYASTGATPMQYQVLIRANLQ